MSDPKEVYLEPQCCADPAYGRAWSEHDAPTDCEDGKPWVRYVLASEVEQLQATIIDRLEPEINALKKEIEARLAETEGEAVTMNKCKCGRPKRPSYDQCLVCAYEERGKRMEEMLHWIPGNVRDLFHVHYPDYFENGKAKRMLDTSDLINEGGEPK